MNDSTGGLGVRLMARPRKLHAWHFSPGAPRIPLCGASGHLDFAPTPEAVTCASCRRIQDSR